LSPHHEIRLLLPWYANGTLNEVEMGMVERHLQNCSECRHAVQLAVGKARWTATDVDHARLAALNARRDHAFDALRLRIGAAPRARVGAARLRRRRTSIARWMPALAAALVATVAVPVIWSGRSAEPTIFELRTSRSPADSPVLQIAFREGTSAEDIDLLIRTSGTVLAGPTPYGIYRIALATEDPAALLERVRAHPAVRWAEIEL
jgi:hypothetical protein